MAAHEPPPPPDPDPGLNLRSRPGGRASVSSGPNSEPELTVIIQLVGERRFRLDLSLPTDLKIAAIMGAQNARAHRKQLLSAGIDRRALDRRVLKGTLIRVHPGVFAIAGVPEPPFAEETGALLATGSLSRLSHHSGAVVLEFRIGTARPIHVTVTDGRCGRRPEGVIVHRSATLAPQDTCIYKGLPVTSPARTLLDIAATLPIKDIARILDQAIAERKVTVAEVEDVRKRNPGHRGAATLRHALQGRTRSRITKSQAETRLKDAIAEAGLPTPLTGTYVLGWECDLYWPEHNLIVEIDDYALHTTRQTYRKDHRRDVEHQLAAHRVLRFTTDQIDEELYVCLVAVASALTLRAAG
jgi:very-short-patch-repair endonuclease